MKFLGIAHDIVISSAALVVDGEIISASPEERFSRIKQDRNFPHQSIKYCLDSLNLKIKDLDGIAIAWNPSRDLVSASTHGYNFRRNRSEHFYSVPLNLERYFGVNDNNHINSTIYLNDLFSNCPEIIYTDHYDCHLFSSLALSGFKECAYGIFDGRAETQTQRLGEIDENLNKLDFLEQNFPNSLGLFYGAITQLLGYKPDGDEWKVMAMGAYAQNPDVIAQDVFRNAIYINNSGQIITDMNLFGYASQWERCMYNTQLLDRLEIKISNEGKLDIPEPRRYQIALSLQHRFEEIMIDQMKILRSRSDSNNLLFSGGCFMNSLFNGKIQSLKLFDDCYIGPFPDDSGTSIGAAYLMYSNAKKRENQTKQNIFPMKRCLSNYYGPEQSNDSIEEDLLRVKIPYEESIDKKHLIDLASNDLMKGLVVGWLQGKSEFGQRALGNRSILLDPRLVKGKDIINSAIKFREAYRPFAPAILKEYFNNFFEGDPNYHYFMEAVAKFKLNLPIDVPAVMNNDRTGRVQVVTSESNELFYQLLSSFYQKTKCPIILNTSFNLNGEPVVLTASDAIKTFYSSGIDVLYIGKFRIVKSLNKD